jgi:hypothetical protein
MRAYQSVHIYRGTASQVFLYSQCEPIKCAYLPWYRLARIPVLKMHVGKYHRFGVFSRFYDGFYSILTLQNHTFNGKSIKNCQNDDIYLGTASQEFLYSRCEPIKVCIFTVVLPRKCSCTHNANLSSVHIYLGTASREFLYSKCMSVNIIVLAFFQDFMTVFTAFWLSRIIPSMENQSKTARTMIIPMVSYFLWPPKGSKSVVVQPGVRFCRFDVLELHILPLNFSLLFFWFSGGRSWGSLQGS